MRLTGMITRWRHTHLKVALGAHRKSRSVYLAHRRGIRTRRYSKTYYAFSTMAMHRQLLQRRMA